MNHSILQVPSLNIHINICHCKPTRLKVKIKRSKYVSSLKKSEINLWVLFNNTKFLKNTMITHLNLKIRFVEISFTSKQIISHTCSCIC